MTKIKRGHLETRAAHLLGKAFQTGGICSNLEVLKLEIKSLQNCMETSIIGFCGYPTVIMRCPLFYYIFNSLL